MKRHNLIGQKFGRLTVVAEAQKASDGHTKWVCKCECGGDKTTTGSALYTGKTQSCGCLVSEGVAKRNFRHGGAKRNAVSPEYSSWKAMLDRCTYPKSIGYANYGGRGIKVCERWSESFSAFLEDMGQRPSLAYSLERQDTNGDYEPGNCVWATDTQQANNHRNNLRVTYGGETLTAKQMWQKHRPAVSYGRFVKRLREGQSVECALLTPPNPLKQNRSKSS